jgi:cell division protein YceG involved in septum cleavage
MRKNKLVVVGVAIFCIIMFTGFLMSGFLSNADNKHPSEESYKYYTSIQIEKGDTLWDIASRYMSEEYLSAETYVQEVKKINSLEDDTIHYGRYLTVPYYSTELK